MLNIPMPTLPAPFLSSDRTVNILVRTFPSSNLPRTICVPIATGEDTDDLCHRLSSILPGNGRVLRDYQLTVANWRFGLDEASSKPCIWDLVRHGDSHLSIDLSYRCLGGKGGFGSQLRAAGGRMSSKRKKNQGDGNGSSRNLDGRRVRTVNEAKALAEYLSIKPDMEKKEKEKRMKRWQQIVETAEAREHELRTGSKAQLDGRWVEDKEEAVDRTREAVLAAMRSGNFKDNMLRLSESETASADNGDDTSEDDESSQSSKPSTPERKGKALAVPRKFFGFDDEYMSSSGEEEEESEAKA